MKWWKGKMTRKAKQANILLHFLHQISNRKFENQGNKLLSIALWDKRNTFYFKVVESTNLLLKAKCTHFSNGVPWLSHLFHETFGYLKARPSSHSNSNALLFMSHRKNSKINVWALGAWLHHSFEFWTEVLLCFQKWYRSIEILYFKT